MNTTVQLQDPFSYSKAPIIIISILLASYILYRLILYFLKQKKKKQKEKEEKPAEPVLKDINVIKQEYLQMVLQLEKQYREGEMDNRQAYTEISRIFRDFVYEVTGVEAPKYTLHDIAGLNMPVLYKLIDHCYHPEFAERSDCNVPESIDMTKRAIELWN